MAPSATVFHFKIELSDVDRGVYQQLDLRVARHPSENMRYLLTRVLAFCLCHEEGIAFSKAGLSSPDEPALTVRDLQGNLRAWIEVGTPSAERLHKASKAAPQVMVFTHNDPELLKRSARATAIHKVEAIVVRALDPTFLDALAAATERTSGWQVVHTEGQLYVTIDGTSVAGAVVNHSLAPDSAG